MEGPTTAAKILQFDMKLTFLIYKSDKLFMHIVI